MTLAESIGNNKVKWARNKSTRVTIDQRALYHLERLQVRLQMMNCWYIFANFSSEVEYLINVI
jgi:hypothetical protein